MTEESQFLNETSERLGVGIADLEKLQNNLNTVKIGLVDATTSDYLFKKACQESDSQDRLKEKLQATHQNLLICLREKAREARRLMVYDVTDESIVESCDFLDGGFTLGEFIEVVARLIGCEATDQAPWIRKCPELEKTDRGARSPDLRRDGTKEKVGDETKQSGLVSPKEKGNPGVTGPYKTPRRSQRLEEKAKASAVSKAL
ncbi:hypothetical protein FPRO04_12286 [Fusarium proliferatum]|nr:hypothetical protein FPRO04_12286 [Fusarium proliferatum]